MTRRRAIRFSLAAALGLAVAEPQPARAAGYPAWWTNRQVVVSTSATNDYFAANLGQLKWFATNACDELEANLPGGAGTTVWALVRGFGRGGNRVAVNLGQLKTVAAPFYDRLIAEGLLVSPPWTTNTVADDLNYAPANLGQLKRVFAFDLTTDADGDGMLDMWETAHSLDPSDPTDAYDDPDDDGVINLLEFQWRTDPRNGQAHPPLVMDTALNPDSGFYTNTVTVTVSTATAGASISYTLDGSAPSPTHGTVHAGTNLTVSVSCTTVLRVMAFKSGMVSTDVDTRTYIFPAAVASQSRPGGYPETWGTDRATTPADYALHGLTAGAVASLTAIPSVCVSLAPDDLFGSGGLYDKPSGEDYEKAAHVELLYPDGRDGVRADCGLKPHARFLETHVNGSGRDVVNLKRSFRLVFRSQYGPAHLRFPALESAPHHAATTLDTYNTLVLRAGSQESYGGYHALDREWNAYTRDQFGRDTQTTLSGDGPRGTYVHLYLNGLYWGLYNLAEYPDTHLLAERYGGAEDDWFIANGDGTQAGASATWTALLALCGERAFTPSDCALVARTNFCDYVLAWWYTGGGDWEDGQSAKNYYVVQNTGTNGPLRFLGWDMELTWLATTLSANGAWVKPTFLDDSVDTQSGHPLACIFRGLWADTDFRQLFADRLYKHTRPEGALGTASAQARWMRLCDSVEDAMQAEAARWGDGALNRDTHWYPARNYPYRLMDGNAERLLLACRNAALAGYPLYPAAWPPLAARNGAQVVLTHRNGTGTIYYTTNGSDPRLPGGGLNQQATAYTAPFTPGGTVTVRARTRTAAEWSALEEYAYEPTQTPRMVIAEVMYHPADGAPGVDPDNYEFIELLNAGTETVNLAGWQFTAGISYTFPAGASLTPAGRMVLVRNATAFTNRYPVASYQGVYTDGLDNGGETLTLKDAGGVTRVSFLYDDNAPWPAQADGEGFSLVLRDAALAPANAASWRASGRRHGSPGREDDFVLDLSDSPPAVSAGPRLVADSSASVPLVGRIGDDGFGGAAPVTTWMANGSPVNGNSVIFGANGTNALSLDAADGGMVAVTALTSVVTVPDSSAWVAAGLPSATRAWPYAAAATVPATNAAVWVSGNGGETSGKGGAHSGPQPDYQPIVNSPTLLSIALAAEWIPFNDDDDNTNGVVDTTDTAVTHETDLVALTWTCLRFAPGTITLSIERGAEHVRLWQASNKVEQVSQLTWNVDEPGFENAFTCWVEGREVSGTTNDVVFRVVYTSSEGVYTQETSTCVGFVDLDADFSRDKAFTLADPDDNPEKQSPGLLVAVAGTGAARTNNFVKLSARGQLNGVLNGEVHLSVGTNGVGRVKIWDNPQGAGTPVLDNGTTNLSEKVWSISPSASLGAWQHTLYVEGIRTSSVPADVTVTLAYYRPNGTNAPVSMAEDMVRISVILMAIAMDGDQDLKIDFADGDDTKCQFWVNDDHDTMHYQEFEWHEDDFDKWAGGAKKPNWDDETIGARGYRKSQPPAADDNHCMRDLEDFTLLQIRVSGLTAALPGVSYALKLRNCQGTPSINIFNAVTNGAVGPFCYLTNAAVATLQSEEIRVGTVSTTECAVFPTHVAIGKPFGYLVEGCATGKADLVFILKQHGAEVCRSTVELDLRPIATYYDIYQIGSVTNKRWGLIGNTKTKWRAEVTTNAVHVQTNTAYVAEADKYLLLVHGWNMSPDDKRYFARTAFKRLWWRGYKGGFGLYDWPGLYDCPHVRHGLSGNIHHYDDSEMIAWLSSTALARLMERMNGAGQLRVWAHSMGNVVFGEAVRKYSGAQQIKTYIATQAAIPGSLYSQSAPATDFDWLGFNCGPSTPNVHAFWYSGTTNGAQPLLADNATKIEKMCNYYNEEDWALRWWERGNRMKPDGGLWYGFCYGGSASAYNESAPVTNRFYRWGSHAEGLEITVSTNVSERYQVFSYALESRARALGQASNAAFGARNRNLQLIIVPRYNDKHYSHSRQFRSNAIEERNYYEKLMEDIGP